MIEAAAVVERVENGLAWVRISDRAGGCGRCDEPGGCRSTKIAYALKAPNEVFSLPDSLGVMPGERIVIALDSGAPLRGALASYGLGTVLLVLGALAGSALAPRGVNVDLLTLGGSAIGLTLAVVLNRVLFRSRRWRNTFQMQMVRDSGRCEIQER